MVRQPDALPRYAVSTLGGRLVCALMERRASHAILPTTAGSNGPIFGEMAGIRAWRPPV
jgi:hypothetical protein